MPPDPSGTGYIKAKLEFISNQIAEFSQKMDAILIWRDDVLKHISTSEPALKKLENTVFGNDGDAGLAKTVDQHDQTLRVLKWATALIMSAVILAAVGFIWALLTHSVMVVPISTMPVPTVVP